MATSRRSLQPTRRGDAIDALAELQGLGPRSAAMLVEAGVASPGELHAVGAVRAFVRVRAAGLQPSLNLLWALEGAIAGVPWHEVARAHRMRLLMELDDATRSG